LFEEASFGYVSVYIKRHGSTYIEMSASGDDEDDGGTGYGSYPRHAGLPPRHPMRDIDYQYRNSQDLIDPNSGLLRYVHALPNLYPGPPSDFVPWDVHEVPPTDAFPEDPVELGEGLNDSSPYRIAFAHNPKAPMLSAQTYDAILGQARAERRVARHPTTREPLGELNPYLVYYEHGAASDQSSPMTTSSRGSGYLTDSSGSSNGGSRRHYDGQRTRSGRTFFESAPLPSDLLQVRMGGVDDANSSSSSHTSSSGSSSRSIPIARGHIWRPKNRDPSFEPRTPYPVRPEEDIAFGLESSLEEEEAHATTELEDHFQGLSHQDYLYPHQYGHTPGNSDVDDGFVDHVEVHGGYYVQDAPDDTELTYVQPSFSVFTAHPLKRPHKRFLRTNGDEPHPPPSPSHLHVWDSDQGDDLDVHALQQQRKKPRDTTGTVKDKRF
jgi:hypothetical protein